jgi:hypothetical protein
MKANRLAGAVPDFRRLRYGMHVQSGTRLGAATASNEFRELLESPDSRIWALLHESAVAPWSRSVDAAPASGQRTEAGNPQRSQ